MAFGTIAKIAIGVGASIIGGKKKKGSGDAPPSSGPDVASTAGLMTPITDPGSATAGLFSGSREVAVAESAGEDIQLATAQQGTDPFALADSVRRSILDEEIA